MKGIFRIVGCSGQKTFTNDKNETVKYQSISIRDTDGTVVVIKAKSDFDFTNCLDEDCEITFRIKKNGSIQAVSAVPA